MSEQLVLTKKHRLLVEAYAGDTVSAMLAAGFSGSPDYLQVTGDKLLANPVIMEAIKQRSKYMAKTMNIIADREERQATLTHIMRNEDPHHKQEKDANGIPIPQGNIPVQARLKALELLGKSEGDFVDNVNVNHQHSFSDLVMKSYNVEESIEAIEAEYHRTREPSVIEAPAAAPVATPQTLSSFL